MELTPELCPEERLFARAIQLAIRDAQQGPTERLRFEAAGWLWEVAPTVAQRAGVGRVFATDNAPICYE